MPDDIDPDLPCGSNSFKVQWCGTGDNNCKYSMRPNCLSKFQCPAGSYCNAGAYAAADKAEAQTRARRVGCVSPTRLGAAAAVTRKVRGNESRRRGGGDDAESRR